VPASARRREQHRRAALLAVRAEVPLPQAGSPLACGHEDRRRKERGHWSDAGVRKKTGNAKYKPEPLACTYRS
jgi:hypothetical protein